MPKNAIVTGTNLYPLCDLTGLRILSTAPDGTVDVLVGKTVEAIPLAKRVARERSRIAAGYYPMVYAPSRWTVRLGGPPLSPAEKEQARAQDMLAAEWLARYPEQCATCGGPVHDAISGSRLRPLYCQEHCPELPDTMAPELGEEDYCLRCGIRRGDYWERKARALAARLGEPLP